MKKGMVRVVVAPELLDMLHRDIVITISLDEDGETLKGCVKTEKDAMPAGMDAPKAEEEAPKSASTVDGGLWMMAEEKRLEGKRRTVETYLSTLNRWRRFLKARNYGLNLPWEKLTKETVEDFEAYMKGDGLARNTTAFYMRKLRAACNSARKNGMTVAENLFADVYTGQAKTKKRAVDMEDIKRIAKVEPKCEMARMARDLFVFSFMTRGMSMIDIANLKAGDIKDGRLSYRRRKTGQRITMEWLGDMQRTVDIYNKVSDDAKRGNVRVDDGQTRLFPIIEHDGDEGLLEFRRTQWSVNRHLKKIGRELQLPLPLTMYVARHSWASVAKERGIPTAMISDAMGHTSEKTTQIYLSQIDKGRIDIENREIVKALR